jgi:hypothetical protein
VIGVFDIFLALRGFQALHDDQSTQCRANPGIKTKRRRPDMRLALFRLEEGMII